MLSRHLASQPPMPDAKMTAGRSPSKLTNEKTIVPTTGSLPNLLVVGAERAGTVSLAQWLVSRNVCPGLPPDGDSHMHMFDFLERFQKGRDDYVEHFRHCQEKNKKILMDSTPSYLHYPGRIHAMYKDDLKALKALKVIVIVREPIARELSEYNHMTSLPTNSQRGLANVNGTTPNKSNQTQMSFSDYVDYVDTVTLPNLQSGASHGYYA